MKKIRSCLALAAAFIGTQVHAAYGDADPGYSTPARWGCLAIASREDGGAYFDLSGGFTPLTGLGVVRVDAHGSPVTSWGQGGFAVYTARTASTARQIVRGKDGDLFAVDSTGVTHFDANGAIDTAFGNGGRAEGADEVLSAALQGDGKIVLLMARNGRYAFVRLNAQGFPDRSFGRSGDPLLVGPPVDVLTVVYGWAVRGDGGVELGTFNLYGNGSLPTPTLTVVDASLSERTVSRVVPQGIAAWMEPQAKADPVGGLVIASFGGVSRYGPDGVLDTSFGKAGSVIIPGKGPSQTISALWREPDGKWTVVSFGQRNSGFFDFFFDDFLRANRLTEHGQLDPSFAPARLGDIATLEHTADGSILLGCKPRRLLTDAPRVEGTLVEYYHPLLDHYFMTSSPNEIAGLDAQGFGWVRTGETFGDWTPANLSGAAHVCRFYGDPVIGPNSHFYTGEDFECNGLIAQDEATPKGKPAWHLEARPFDIAIPTHFTCPANLQPVYRAFNGPASRNGDPNHRYTTDPAVYAAMLAKGWLPEDVHFCAPPRNN